MKTIKFNGHRLQMFDSIQETRINRFHLYNLNVLLDAGIGSDLNDFSARTNKVIQLIPKSPDQAVTEMNNLLQLVYFIMKNTSPAMNSFVVMIRTIDGREVTDDDLNPEGIAAILAELNEKGLTIGVVNEFLEFIKKKFDRELETFFPKIFNTSAIKEFYSKLKRRTLLILQSIQTATDPTDQIRAIDDYFAQMTKPKNFHGPSGAEVRTIKGFEQMCILLTRNQMTTDPKNMTTLAFFQALEVIRDQEKKK